MIETKVQIDGANELKWGLDTKRSKIEAHMNSYIVSSYIRSCEKENITNEMVKAAGQPHRE